MYTHTFHSQGCPRAKERQGGEERFWAQLLLAQRLAEDHDQAMQALRATLQIGAAYNKPLPLPLCAWPSSACRSRRERRTGSPVLVKLSKASRMPVLFSVRSW